MAGGAAVVMTRPWRSFAAPAPATAPAPAPPSTVSRLPDRTDLVQRAIDAAITDHRPLVLPSGQFRITSTLRIASASGFLLQGSGTAIFPMADAGGWASRQIGTELVWAGPPDQPLLDLPFSIGCTFRDLCFTGGTVRVTSKPGWGAGNHVFERVTFAHAKLGLQLGENPGDNNCADITLRDVCFSNCQTGLLTLNDQSVNLNLFNVGGFFFGAEGCTLVHISHGGDLRWYGGAGTLAGPSTVLKIDGAGDNASTFVLSGWRFEAAHDWPVLVDAGRASGTCNIVIEGLSDADSAAANPDNPDPGALRLGPGVAAVVRSSTLRRHLAVLRSDARRTATLVVEDSILPGRLDRWVTVDGGSKVYGVRNRKGYEGTPLADWSR